MAIVEDEPLIQPAQRLLTVSDLEALPSELPSGPIDYELDNGRLVVVEFPFTAVHGATTANFVAQLSIQGERNGYGKARARVGIVLWRNPDRVAAPDAAFIANKSLPIRESPEGYLETIPELVVEVVDRNDSLEHIRRKVQHYLKAGVEIIWIADPTTTTVTIHSATSEPVVYREGDTLQLPGVIPGFSTVVAEVFRE